MDSVRLEAYPRLLVETRGNVERATKLEAAAWATACYSGTVHGIPAWFYTNGATLCETVKPEVHHRCLAASYLTNIERLIQELQKEPGLDARTFITRPEHAAEASSAYAAWRDQYLEGLRLAKQVLQERSAADAAATFITCSRCKSNAVDTEQKQTRSADEPMTIFCMCRKCGKRFTLQ